MTRYLERCAFGCDEPIRSDDDTVSCGAFGIGHRACRDRAAAEVKDHAVADGQRASEPLRDWIEAVVRAAEVAPISQSALIEGGRKVLAVPGSPTLDDPGERGEELMLPIPPLGSPTLTASDLLMQELDRDTLAREVIHLRGRLANAEAGVSTLREAVEAFIAEHDNGDCFINGVGDAIEPLRKALAAAGVGSGEGMDSK